MTTLSLGEADDRAWGEAADLLVKSERVVVLTGAGVSTESGIPDFRSPGGIWDRYNPAELTFDRFRTRPGTRRTYWQLATESYPVLAEAEPNAGHFAIAEIERVGKLECLVTQNIDGLHLRAGSSPERLVEIHGSSLRAKCIDCEAEHDRAELHRRISAGEIEVPLCDACGGFVKPATISFGQAMPVRETALAFEAAAACDLMIVVGSSLQVYPAASLPDEAVRAGAKLIIVNNEATPKDSLADIVVRGSAGVALGGIVREARLGQAA